METKKILKNLLFSVALISGIVVTTNTAFAAEVDSENTTAKITFGTGELSITSAPSLDFGTKTIATNTQVYTTDIFTNDLSISDLRGTNAGWKVSAKLGIFQNSGDTLSGSTLSLNTPTVSAESGTQSTGPDAPATVTLPSDNTEVNIETAAVDTGSGLWHTSWSQAALKVLPGTAKSGVSTSQIDWILSDAP